MSNILLVFTGGTIGSTASNGRINTSSKQTYKLLDLFQQSYPDHSVFFKTLQPLQILSENLFTAAWETLVSAIEAEDLSQFDGVIVTHGTDTLAFSAAALGLYFNTIEIPLLIVSSDYPLEHSQANGINHFHCAIEFIKQRNQAGVFVPYKNQNAEMVVHIGTRLASSLQLSSDFISVQSKAYLHFKQNSFLTYNVIKSPERIPAPLSPHFSTRILLIKPYPGLDYSQFNLDQVDVVLHDLYHSGTACYTAHWGENYSLVTFLKKCQKNHIGLYMAPAIKTADAYESTKVLIEQGAKMIWNMSLETAYVKLLLAYGNYNNEFARDEFLATNIAFEHIN